MLSKDESLAYITNVFGIQQPEEEMNTNRLAFLNKLIRAFYAAMPFQNVTLMSKPLSERHVPSLAEIKQSLYRGTGGLCTSLNISFFILLRSIGFDVYMNLSRVFLETNIQENHAILLARNVDKDGDMYLIDVGAAHPTFQAIRLDFKNESPIYHDSYSFYKFIHEAGDIIRRVLDRSILFLSNDKSSEIPKSGEFMPFYEFKVNPTTDIDQLREHINIIYTEPDLTPFHNSVRAIKFKDKRLVLISNCKLVLEAEDGSLNIEILPDDETIVAAYKEHFPELEEASVRKALQNWRSI